jgi:hypothetical protein
MLGLLPRRSLLPSRARRVMEEHSHGLRAPPKIRQQFGPERSRPGGVRERRIGAVANFPPLRDVLLSIDGEVLPMLGFSRSR